MHHRVASSLVRVSVVLRDTCAHSSCVVIVYVRHQPLVHLYQTLERHRWVRGG